jgi:hypothetical protein
MSVDAASLYQAFEQVRDGRDPPGRRYPLPLLLTLLLLGKLAGETKISGVVDSCQRARGLGARPTRMA